MAKSVVGALRVVLGLDSAQFERGIKRVNKSNSQLVKNSQVASNAVRGLAASLGIVGVGGAAKAYIGLADQSAKLTAQLKLATAQSGSFAQAQEDVRRIAASSRTGLEEVANLYATFQRNAHELGITQEQAARSTETITKAFRISGATAAEAAGGLRQFLQGIQSGVLRGEELNSVLENAPRLARALADGLGVTIGQLRAMGKEGKLTGEAVVGALEDAAASIDSEFSQLPVTFDESMTLVHNAAIETFGEFDRGGGFSRMLANFVSDGATGFGDLGDSAREAGIQIRAAFETLGDVFDPIISGIQNTLNWMDRLNAQNQNKGFAETLDGITAAINKPLGMKGTNLVGILAANERPLRRGIAEQDWQARNRRVDAMGNPIGGLGPVGSGGGGAASGGKKKGKKGKSAETLRKEAEREAQRAADALRRFTDMVAREDADLSEALARLSGNTDELAEAELEQIEADRAARARAIQADDNLDAAQREQLLILNDDNANAQRRLVRKQQHEDTMQKQERIAVAGLDLEIELLSLSSNLARTAAGQRDIELRILDMAFERERLALEGIKATSAATSAEWQIADARLKQLGELQSGARQQVIRQTQGPLESYLDRLPRTADEAREALERVQVDGIDGIIDGLADAATGARSLGDVFKSVTNQIIADLIRIQLRKALVGALSSAIGGGGGIDFGALGGNTAAGMGSKSLAGLQSSLPGFATGGSFKVGGMPGVDQNIVAFKATRGEMVDIRTPGQSGKTDIQVIPSPYFDVVVDGRVMNAAPGIAQGGAALASQRSAFANSRRLA